MVERWEGRVGIKHTHGGRLFMFTICCTKLNVAVIMACEAVSCSPVSVRIYGPVRMVNSQSQEYQKRRQSLGKVSRLLRGEHTAIRTKREVRSNFQGWSNKRCCA